MKEPIENINFYQEKCKETAIYPNQGNNLNYTILGLIGEAGELANLYKKVIRDDNGILTDEKKEKLKSELSDCMWYFAMMCSELDILPSEILTLNIDKLKDRQERNVLGGSGDKR